MTFSYEGSCGLVFGLFFNGRPPLVTLRAPRSSRRRSHDRVALVLIYPCGLRPARPALRRLRKTSLSASPSLIVAGDRRPRRQSGSLRRFAPWTATPKGHGDSDPKETGGSCGRTAFVTCPAPMGSLTSSRRLENPPFPLALHRVGSVLAVKGGFGPWGARGKGGVRVASPLAHDKGYYHSYIKRSSCPTTRH